MKIFVSHQLSKTRRIIQHFCIDFKTFSHLTNSANGLCMMCITREINRINLIKSGKDFKNNKNKIHMMMSHEKRKMITILN